MLRFVLLSILCIYPLKTLATSFYTVNIAVYKDKVLLNEKLKKLPPQLRKTIKIDKINGLHKVKTLPKKDKKALTKLLPAYKKVFKDAFISTIKQPNILQKPAKTPIKIESHKKTISLQDLIHQKTFYLSSKKETTKEKQYLMKVVFKNTNVHYIPILGKMPPVTALYKTDKNKLFLYQKGLFNKDIYSKLEKYTKKFLLISHWIKNNKINTLRYYYNLKNAKVNLK